MKRIYLTRITMKTLLSVLIPWASARWHAKRSAHRRFITRIDTDSLSNRESFCKVKYRSLPLRMVIIYNGGKSQQ